MAQTKEKNTTDEQKVDYRPSDDCRDKTTEKEFIGVHVIDADDMKKHFDSSGVEESNDRESDNNRR